MSIDQIAFILENCHQAKYEPLPYGIAIKFKLRKDEDWQEIEVEKSVFSTLQKRHKDIIEKWGNVE